MTKSGLQNPALAAGVAALGHTDYFCISDVGLRAPAGVHLVDVSVAADIPAFLDVLQAVARELVFESAILAEELANNSSYVKRIQAIIGDVPIKWVAHEEFKRMTDSAKCIVRTGERTPYANIILVGGVNF